MSQVDLLGRLERPRWDREGRDWPNREASRFVEVGRSRFHVQILGEGPVLLLLHGAGASTHSFRDLAPLLARSFTVVAPDLPGHGFTEVPREAGLGLEAMARHVEALISSLDMPPPELLVGHSAGAAIGLRAVLDGRLSARLAVGLNPALVPLRGAAARFFGPVARFAARRPLASRVAAWSAGQGDRVARTLEGTGSRIDRRGIELYRRLAQSPGHVAGTVRMMAEWDLDPLAGALERLQVPLLLILGEEDRAIPPADGREIARRVPRCEVVKMPRLGHLAHEEAPEATAVAIDEEARRLGLLASRSPNQGDAPESLD